MRDVKFSLDVSKQGTLQMTDFISLGSANSTRYIITLNNKGENFYLTGHDVMLQAEKADGTTVFIDCLIKSNRVYFVLPEQITTAIGKVSCCLFICKENSYTYSPSFEIVVRENAIDENKITSSSSFTALETLLNKTYEVYNLGFGEDIAAVSEFSAESESTTICEDLTEGKQYQIAYTVEKITNPELIAVLRFVIEGTSVKRSLTRTVGKHYYTFTVPTGATAIKIECTTVMADGITPECNISDIQIRQATDKTVSGDLIVSGDLKAGTFDTTAQNVKGAINELYNSIWYRAVPAESNSLGTITATVDTPILNGTELDLRLSEDIVDLPAYLQIKNSKGETIYADNVYSQASDGSINNSKPAVVSTYNHGHLKVRKVFDKFYAIEVRNDVELKENRTTSITDTATDSEYPTAKAVKAYADDTAKKAESSVINKVVNNPKYLESIDCDTFTENGTYSTSDWSNIPSGLTTTEDAVIDIKSFDAPMYTSDNTPVRATTFKYLTVIQTFNCSSNLKYERRTSGLFQKNSGSTWAEVTTEFNSLFSSEYTTEEVQEIFAGQSTLENISWEKISSGEKVQEHGTWTPTFDTKFIASLTTCNCTYTKLSDTEVFIYMALVGVGGSTPQSSYLNRQFTGFPFVVKKYNGISAHSGIQKINECNPFVYITPGEKRIDMSALNTGASFSLYVSGVVTIE